MELDDEEAQGGCWPPRVQEESGLDQLARVGFRDPGLQTYLTAGPKESRLDYPGGCHGGAGGRRCHRFQAGSSKAGWCPSTDLVDAVFHGGGEGARQVRMEGKDHVMADGDVWGCFNV